jgi:hypothetical protein
MGQHNHDGLGQIRVDVVQNSGILGVSGQIRWLGQHVIGTRRRSNAFTIVFACISPPYPWACPQNFFGMTFAFHTNNVFEFQTRPVKNKFLLFYKRFAGKHASFLFP